MPDSFTRILSPLSILSFTGPARPLVQFALTEVVGHASILLPAPNSSAALGLRHPKITSGLPAAYKPLHHLHCLLRSTLHTAPPQVDWRDGEAPNYPVANLERVVHQLNNVHGGPR